ncbi:MAG TPA: NAD(P)/FAD-dependent oxidoreductase [Oligoflexus sp.]|uniref:flavin-containing monooxygenase n=1 Tax=Oligoflexus sp. TaxID=1971216 RepID=UPI002D7F39B7|nr:NAD(P)/FAD-dependent oxidoreductase [Oligoflexus sp.]HET9238507.1 NAD(P)/FAD-dependent oxidoreductase [Oligoflexus sp.]
MNPGRETIVIVGTGFSGLGMAIRLKKAGIDDFVLLEKAGEVGGTWRENHYPGAACDVPSPVYSFSFEPNPKWSRVFSPQAEILAYLKHCADKYQIRPHIRFHSEVSAASYEVKSGLWTVQIQGQSPLVCRFLILASGGLSRPSYPNIPGLKNFQGALFHTAAWRHDVPLHGQRVAVIGTGASAIQVVPEMVRVAGEVKVFQRTPAWILPKPDGLMPQRSRPGNWLLRKLLYWQFEMKALALLRPKLMRYGQKMALAFLKDEVPDPKLREKLTPDYIMGCKRILLSNDFYKAMSQPQTQLITSGIEEVTARGIRTRDGAEHELDAVICATGFQVAEASAPFPIQGRRGLVLSEVWKDGAQAYLGTTVSGFPNMFIIVGPNSGLGHNSIVFIIESQVQYILGALRTARKKGWKSLEVKAGIQKAFNERIQKRFQNTVWSREHCVSWYQTPSGKNTTIWPGFSFTFRLRTLFFDRAAYETLETAAGQEAGQAHLNPLSTR